MASQQLRASPECRNMTMTTDRRSLALGNNSQLRTHRIQIQMLCLVSPRLATAIVGGSGHGFAVILLRLGAYDTHGLHTVMVVAAGRWARRHPLLVVLGFLNNLCPLGSFIESELYTAWKQGVVYNHLRASHSGR